MDPPIRHLPLRYNRITALPKFEKSKLSDVLDVSPTTIFFRCPQFPSRTIITVDIESETFSDPICLPIPDNFEIESFNMIDAITAVSVLQSTTDYGRRVAILRASDSKWNKVDLLSLIEKEWIHKQHLDLLIQFNQTTFYIHTFYRAKLNESRVDIRSMGSVTDDMEFGDPYSSFLQDTNRILMVKALFNLESINGASQIGTTDVCTTEYSIGYMLKSISLYVYTVDLAIESIDKKDFTLEIPPNLHVCTDTTTMSMIGNELVFSQPGGCIMYNIEEETFTKYTMEDSSREYMVKSVMGGNGLLGITNDENLFRGYLKTVPSLREMTHSIVQVGIPSYPSEDLSISNLDSLIRSLFI
ncbi:hypothetical protein PRIPAC_83996 [Pristionchus pacificus]|uniref:Uncharacterized protein n=1 Tax=Pristionchus pacificus TaxID=54126 RepID=A0A2A6BW96_PRIPA|nr:hypothetical protein PRIPAC_83996 [Pristionchus pacificus]|eukprot:PDM70106.1 hypothetical protein PRIPAC_43846 [Pristionchus pacificus]